jgi:hypothetical protein
MSTSKLFGYDVAEGKGEEKTASTFNFVNMCRIEEYSLTG